MFEWLKNYLLLQEIKSGSNTEKHLIEWESVKSVVVLVQSSQYEIVKDFARQTQKNVDIIVIHHDKVSETRDCYLSLNKKDFNFFGLPNQQALQKLRQKTFDVLINNDFSNSGFLKAIAGLTQAKCKLGPESAVYNEFFDISIQVEQKEFLKQALKYLMMIKN